MNDEQEKTKLWNNYKILMGIMLGGTVLVLGGQSVWNTIQQNSSTSTINQNLSSTQSFSSTPSSASPTSSVSRPSTEQALRDYFSAIKSNQYTTAWNQLDFELQNSKSLHPNGFNSFTDWWTKVKHVKIQQVSSQEINTETATIDAQVQYLMQSGETSSQSLRFFFCVQCYL